MKDKLRLCCGERKFWAEKGKKRGEGHGSEHSRHRPLCDIGNHHPGHPADFLPHRGHIPTRQADRLCGRSQLHHRCAADLLPGSDQSHQQGEQKTPRGRRCIKIQLAIRYVSYNPGWAAINFYDWWFWCLKFMNKFIRYRFGIQSISSEFHDWPIGKATINWCIEFPVVIGLAVNCN